MTATSHALTGALVATIVTQPILAVPLAFLSHFICDSLPHFGMDMEFASAKMYTWLVIDGLLLVTSLSLVLLHTQNDLLIVGCAAAAISPDLAWLYNGSKRVTNKSYGWFSRFHSSIQLFEKPSGLMVDAVWSIVMIGFIVRLR